MIWFSGLYENSPPKKRHPAFRSRLFRQLIRSIVLFADPEMTLFGNDARAIIHTRVWCLSGKERPRTELIMVQHEGGGSHGYKMYSTGQASAIRYRHIFHYFKASATRLKIFCTHATPSKKFQDMRFSPKKYDGDSDEN
jgi:hypothetical protein